MKLYVCWNSNPGPKGMHPCGAAMRALRAAGYEPDVVKSRGLRFLPGWLNNRFEGRREAFRLTKSHVVPVLVTDTGEVVSESKRIIEWAEKHPASRAT